jgi:LysR family hydrogen peroxide-inducible transcriptional activator
MSTGRTILPTLRQLQFLTALQTEGNFVRAAEHVGVTQPTLSAGIQELEALLGCLLVERARSGLNFTPEGREAVERASRLLEDAAELVRATQACGEPLSGDFRLGAIPTVAPYVLPRLAPALKQRHPKLRLFLREDLTGRLIEALRARTLDAALLALPYAASGIETEALFDDEFLLATPPDHPLAGRKPLRISDLGAEQLLLLEDGHCLREHAATACGALAGRQNTEVSATSLATLAHMAAGGIGVTLLPRLAVEGGSPGGAELALSAFDPPLIGRAIGVAWRAGGAKAEEARLIGAMVRATMRG